MPCGKMGKVGKIAGLTTFFLRHALRVGGLETLATTSSLHLYAPRHSYFVPPHTIRSEDTWENADAVAVIGCIVSTLAGLAAPSGPIAAGALPNCSCIHR